MNIKKKYNDAHKILLERIADGMIDDGKIHEVNDLAFISYDDFVLIAFSWGVVNISRYELLKWGVVNISRYELLKICKLIKRRES